MIFRRRFGKDWFLKVDSSYYFEEGYIRDLFVLCRVRFLCRKRGSLSSIMSERSIQVPLEQQTKRNTFLTYIKIQEMSMSTLLIISGFSLIAQL